MSDFTGEFFLDPGIVIKQEPMGTDSAINISASVPIPSRRTTDIYGMHDYNFDVETSQSPSYLDVGLLGQPNNTPEIYPSFGNGTWATRFVGDMDISKNEALIHMDDDDIFQVDKADLIQGPTLAELNANDEMLLEDLNFDDLLLPEDGSYGYVNVLNTGINKLNTQYSTNNNNHLNNNSHLATNTSRQQPLMGYYRENLEPISIPSSPFDSYSSKTPISAFSPASQTSSNSSILQSVSSPSQTLTTSTLQQKHTTLHELLKRDKCEASPDRSVLGQSVPGQSSTSGLVSALRMHRGHNSRLSSSAPTHLGLEQIWARREPRKHLLSTGSLAEAGSTSSISTGGVLSPEAHDFSNDELDSDEDSEHYEDYSSDNDSDDGEEKGHRHSTSPGKKERFFWQYNVQAKGPKGQRLIMKTKMEDPHVLNEVTDPVFSPNCSVRGIKHSGKARKGDGNDLTPNPRKLYSIGKELDKLGRIINDMTPVSELPFNVRPKTRKEKNKLASRACRLKKKAQHEANKIKLQGLESEHKRLISALIKVKEIIATKAVESVPDNQDELSQHVENIMKTALKSKIAGNTTEYVNKILDKLKGVGPPSASLDDI